MLQRRAGKADIESKADAAFVAPPAFLRVNKLTNAVFGTAVEMVAFFLEAKRFELGYADS